MGRKVRGHERPARLGAGRGLGGLFEPIPTGAGGGSSAGSSHDVSTGLDSAVTHHCTRGASDGVESRWSAGKEEGSPRRRGWRHCVYRAGRFRDGGGAVAGARGVAARRNAEGFQLRSPGRRPFVGSSISSAS